MTCTLCRKYASYRPELRSRTKRTGSVTCAGRFAGAPNTVVRRQRLCCETRECSTGMPHCPARQIWAAASIKRERTASSCATAALACARSLCPNAPDALSSGNRTSSRPSRRESRTPTIRTMRKRVGRSRARSSRGRGKTAPIVFQEQTPRQSYCATAGAARTRLISIVPV